VDIATITSAIGAAASAVGLVDKIADQLEYFLTDRPEPSVPMEHRLKIDRSNDTIVIRSGGKEIQRITGTDLQNLPEYQLLHIKVLERSMEDHYSIWAEVFPQLAFAADAVAKAKTKQQLRSIIADMKDDLNGILDFLTRCGVHLDDHYMYIRSLVNSV
jgi:hypothetical protein